MGEGRAGADAGDRLGAADVTVVTPCLNSVKTIRETLESVRQQGPRVEHIVMDGGSTDGTVQVLESAPGISWVSEADGGQSAAINGGIARSSGSILTWLNGDDTLAADAVAIARSAIPDPSHQVVVYRDLLTSASGIGSIWRPPSSLTLDDLASGATIPQPGTFFTRAAWDASGGLDDRFHLAMDYALWLKMLRADTRFLYRPGIGATFAIDSSTKTGSISRGRFLSEEAQALQTAGLHAAAEVARGRAAYYDGGVAVSRDARAGLALERLRQRRSLLAGVGSSITPALWASSVTRRYLVRRLARPLLAGQPAAALRTKRAARP